MDRSERVRILADYGATAAEVEELAAYTENRFQLPAGPVTFPLEDEPHVQTWRRYAAQAALLGVFPVLQKALVQLRFPISEGISATEEYRAATRRGIAPQVTSDRPGLRLRRPDDLRLILHPTPAGTLPVLVVPERADFVTLMQALAMRNEPKPVPPSMGATIVSGLVNWDRVAEMHRRWQTAYPLARPEEWDDEMARILPHKALYQDRVILLSTGPYSDVPAGDMDLAGDEWLRISLTIRLEHECAHYLMRRLAGSMRNNAFDEILADYAGIVCAAGAYRPDWFLRFMGLERWPEFRPGGRLENYRGEPPLSDGAFRVLQAVTRDATLALARYPAVSFRPGDLAAQGEALLHLSTLTLLDLATLAPPT